MKKASIKDIPIEFRTSYQFSKILYDNIVFINRNCFHCNVYSTVIKFKKRKEIDEFEKINDEEILDWLLKNNYKESYYNIIFKSTVKNLIEEYTLFLGEALENILKGNLSVVFTLLRKPFKEILTIFELLYDNPARFLAKFCHGNTNLYDPQSRAFKKEDRIKLIQRINKKLKSNRSVDSQFIYELRFDIDKYYSYDQLWHKAVHLVTNAPSIETEKMNFNFIFSNAENDYDQQNYISTTLPILLHYSYYVIEGVLNTISKPIGLDIYKNRRNFGLLAWISDIPLSSTASKKKIQKIISKAMGKPHFTCPQCKNKIIADNVFFANYSFNWIIKCKHCTHKIEIWKEENSSYR